jgi:hypothetical protein
MKNSKSVSTRNEYLMDLKRNPEYIIFLFIFFLIPVIGIWNPIVAFVLIIFALLLIWIIKLKRTAFLGERAVKYLHVMHPELRSHESNYKKYFSHEPEDRYFNFDKLCSIRGTDVAGLIALYENLNVDGVIYRGREFVDYLKIRGSSEKLGSNYEKFFRVDEIFLDVLDGEYDDFLASKLATDYSNLLGKLRWNILMAFSIGNFSKEQVLTKLTGYKKENSEYFNIASRVVNLYFCTLGK